MSTRILKSPAVVFVLSCLFTTVLLGNSAQAQNNNNNNNNNNQNNQNAGGIIINALGLIQPSSIVEDTGKVGLRRRRADAKKMLTEDMNVPSELRKVSLVKLAEECKQFSGNVAQLPLELKFLAGLNRIDYVFVYPEEGDIVIAGPADGFAENMVGRMVSTTSGRPTLRLDDLIAAFRAVANRQEIGCSIDPIPEQLAAFERYLRQNSTPASTAVVQRRFVRMAQILGLHDIRIWGVPKDSHFAQILVEADYRMKRVSMGLEKAKVRGFRSHLSMLAPNGNSLQRWWFMPLYEPFVRSAERNAYQISGPRAQLLSQEEVTNKAGQRSAAATTRVSLTKYAKHFTDKFPEIAEKLPVFAEMQNLFDLAVVAALIDKEQLGQQVDWTPTVFLDEQKLDISHGNIPKQVHAIVNIKKAQRGMIMGLVGGGVVLNANATLARFLDEDENDKSLQKSHDAAKLSDEAKTRWWWD